MTTWMFYSIYYYNITHIFCMPIRFYSTLCIQHAQFDIVVYFFKKKKKRKEEEKSGYGHGSIQIEFIFVMLSIIHYE